MRPVHLKLRNWRQWRELDLDITPGVTVLRGLPTAGKSSILYAIDTAAFAPARAGAVLEANRTHGTDEVILELVCEHAGETYRIRRAQKGRKTTLDFDQLLDGGEHGTSGWVPLTRDTMPATQDLINETFGVTPAIWRAGTFFARGDASFVAADRSERRELLGEILHLDQPWSRLRELAKGERRRLEHELARLGGVADQAEHDEQRRRELADQLADAYAAATRAESDLRDAEARLEKTREAAEHARAQQTARADAERLVTEKAVAYRSAQERADRLAAALEGAADAEASIGSLDAEGSDARIAELERDHSAALAAAEAERRLEQEHRAHVSEQSRLRREAEDADRLAAIAETKRSKAAAEHDHLEQHTDAACPTCGTVVADERKQQALAQLAAERRQHEAEYGHYVEQAGRLREAAAAVGERVSAAAQQLAGDRMDPAPLGRVLAEARRAGQELAAARARVAQAAEVKAQHAAANAELPALSAAKRDAERAAALLPATSDVQAALNEHDDARRAVEHERHELGQVRQRVARLGGLVEEIDDRLTKARAAAQQADDHRVALVEIKVCEDAYAADGIPALLVESIAVPQLEQEATRILGELDMAYRCELRTQREKADGSGAVEALDVWFCSPAGDVAWDGLSDSERERANLALRFALAQLLARQRGVEHGFLALDEPRHFDDHLYERLADVLRRMQATFHTIYVVSHHAALRDAFDQALTVERDETGASTFAEEAIPA